MSPTDLLAHFDSRRDQIIGSIREIVDIESPSRDAERSSLVADWVVDQFRSTGVDLDIERIVETHGIHVIIEAFSGEGPATFLLGHTDTVHPVGTNELNPTRIDGDKFYGCGIFDMKANIVLMIEAFKYFAETDTRPSGPVTIFLSCDEEIGSHGGRPILERLASGTTRCLVFEPSAAGKVKTGRKGTGLYTVHAHGTPAHAGLEPDKGANAVAELARQVERIHAIADSAQGTTVNVCTFSGGTTSNVIPEHAVCEADVRFSTMVEAERVDRAFRALSSTDPRVTLEIKGSVNRPPMERTPAVVELYEKARNTAASFGYELGETQVGGASDGNFVAALGVPVVDGLGITGDGAHTLGEHILIRDIAARAALLSLLLSGDNL